MMHYLYRITNQLNGKIYIGQSIKPEYRWSQHKSHSAEGSDHKQYLHNSIAKHGISNFIFEVIASSQTQKDADETESILIVQYNSRNKDFGYNIKPGGNTSPQSEETKQKQREATLRQIAEKGHPAQGTKRTEEQRAVLSAAQQARNFEEQYNEEVRQRMSEAHIGIKDTEETKRKKSESSVAAWAERIDYSRRCSVPGCEVSGKAKYKIINNIRYCNKHGLRMLRYGRLECLNA